MQWREIGKRKYGVFVLAISDDVIFLFLFRDAGGGLYFFWRIEFDRGGKCAVLRASVV